MHKINSEKCLNSTPPGITNRLLGYILTEIAKTNHMH